MQRALPSISAPSAPTARPSAIAMRQPAAMAMRPAISLVTMPPFDSSEAALPPIASISGVISRISGMKRGRGVAARIAGVEAVDVGQQHQRVGRDHLGDARAEAIVVAEADLVGRHRVVLVDHRHGAQPEQRAHGLARVEIAAALLGIVERQQHLRHGDAVARQRLLVGVGELDLAGGGGGLALLELERAGRQLEMRAAEPDGAGGDQHDLAAAFVQARDVVGQRFQPVAPDLALRLVDQDGGADLHDQPFEPA